MMKIFFFLLFCYYITFVSSFLSMKPSLQFTRSLVFSKHRMKSPFSLREISMCGLRSSLIGDLTGKNTLSSGKAASQFTFVGGKGGVGKTTTSSAIALSCSDNKLKTLIASTDPAHSLGDALDVDLSSGKVIRIPTEMNLWALEIDVKDSMEEFKNIVKQLESGNLADDLGIPRDIIDAIGLEDVADIFANPPPGIDEIVALSKIFQYASLDSSDDLSFDRIIVDTAPTGHTLRLLQLPVFLNSLTSKLIKVRAKITNAITSFKNMFSGEQPGAAAPGDKILEVLNKLDTLQSNIQRVQSTLKDQSATQFIVVTIPTQLAVRESERLVKSLQSEGIRVSSIICNQMLEEGSDEKYVTRRAASQRSVINQLKAFVDGRNIEVNEVPFVDTEVTGLYGLRFFHGLAHKPQPKSATNPIDSRKLTIFGGKGGVGKTTSSASWGVRLSDSGFRTLVVSTDPAHSLGDAFSEALGGLPKKLDLPSPEGGQIWAMEIDPQEALAEFSELVKGAMQRNDKSSGGMMDSLGFSGIKEDVTEILFDIKNPPPGTDEIVALAKVVNYLDNGYTTSAGNMVKFDRIVLDTAPTGHTMRMLQLPAFLQKLIKKILTLSEKVDTFSNSPLGAMMGMSGQGSGTTSSPTDTSIPDDGVKMNKAKLAKFAKSMERLESLLHSPQSCEFIPVTIPTELATAETKRLLAQLRKEDILVRRLVMNQVIEVTVGGDSGEKANAFLSRLRKGQESSMSQLITLSNNAQCSLVRVPYFDMEVRTVYGLRVVSNALLKQEADTSNTVSAD